MSPIARFLPPVLMALSVFSFVLCLLPLEENHGPLGRLQLYATGVLAMLLIAQLTPRLNIAGPTSLLALGIAVMPDSPWWMALLAVGLGLLNLFTVGLAWWGTVRDRSRS